MQECVFLLDSIRRVDSRITQKQTKAKAKLLYYSISPFLQRFSKNGTELTCLLWFRINMCFGDSTNVFVFSLVLVIFCFREFH